MPELPEVQTIVNDLKDSGLFNLPVKEVIVRWPGIIFNSGIEDFTHRLIGKRILSIERRGKYIHMGLTNGLHLVIHLRLTGKLLVENRYRPPAKHEHLILYFENDRFIYYHDVRKFGKFYLTTEPESILGKLGIEPLGEEFSGDWLIANLSGKTRQIKPLLLDQSFIAGMGNIYVDEALWEAGIHPRKKACELDSQEIRTLHSAIRKVLNKGLKNLGTSLGNTELNYLSSSGRRGRNQESLNVFRRQGNACFRCGTEIKRIVVARRGTHICPHCQQLSKN